MCAMFFTPLYILRCWCAAPPSGQNMYTSSALQIKFIQQMPFTSRTDQSPNCPTNPKNIFVVLIATFYSEQRKTKSRAPDLCLRQMQRNCGTFTLHVAGRLQSSKCREKETSGEMTDGSEGGMKVNREGSSTAV